MSDKDHNLFLTLQHQNKIPLALVEGIFVSLNESPNISMKEVLLSLHVPDALLEETALAITDWFNSEETVKSEGKSAKNSVKIGTAFHDTFSKAGFTEVCLIVAEFNIIEALRLYHEEDFRLVLSTYKLKTKLIMAEAVTTYEAMAAVMGGGASGSDDNETVIDVSEGLPGGMISG